MLMVEARRAERVRCFLRARVVFNNGGSTVDCIVRNMSATGAKIELSNAVSVPAEFDLDVPQKNRVFRARMMWRNAENIRLQFIEIDKPAKGNDVRVDRLLAENRKLYDTVAILSKRLTDIGQDISEIV